MAVVCQVCRIMIVFFFFFFFKKHYKSLVDLLDSFIPLRLCHSIFFIVNLTVHASPLHFVFAQGEK